jgi:hypothetical protein
MSQESPDPSKDLAVAQPDELTFGVGVMEQRY